ncbi:unnamed protein product [Closterium sp. Yama58-4]|nr:unnamed protein product [Closterium sp. Yama58-4]
MAAFPSALLPLLVLAVIVGAAAMAHARHGLSGAGNVVTARRSVKSEITAGSASRSESMQITVPGVSLPVSFDALRCFTLPRAAHKAGQDVQVWWHGLAGGSSDEGGSPREKEAGTAAVVACKQLQFFGNPVCKGKVLDEVLKPQFTGLRKQFNEPRHHLRAGHVSQQLHLSSDKLSCIDKCDAVNCRPGGNCTKDAKGNPFCICSTGFTLSSDKLSCIDNCGPNGTCVRMENGDPTCACDSGFLMPPGELRCIAPSFHALTSGIACNALGCKPDGVCVNTNGVHSCNWSKPGFHLSLQPTQPIALVLH